MSPSSNWNRMATSPVADGGSSPSGDTIHLRTKFKTECYYIYLKEREIGRILFWAYNCIGWSILPEYRNNGFTTQAVNLAIPFILSKRVIYAHIDSTNFSSRKVAEKCGFILDSIKGNGANRLLTYRKT